MPVFGFGKKKEKSQSEKDFASLTKTLFQTLEVYKNENNEFRSRILALEEKVAEDQIALISLQSQLTLLRTAYNDSPFPTWLKDTNGVMLDLNPAYENLFLKPMGLTKVDYIGKTDYHIWPEDVAAKYIQNDLRAMKSEYWIGEEKIMVNDNNVGNIWQILKYGRYMDGVCVGVTGKAIPVLEGASIIGIKDVEKLIANGQIKRPLEILEKITYGDDRKTIQGMKARFTRIKKGKDRGAIDDKDYNIEVNNIIDSILEMIS